MLMFPDRRKFLKMAHLVDIYLCNHGNIYDPDKSLKMPLNFKQFNIFQSTVIIIIIVYFLILMLLFFLKMILIPVHNFHAGEKSDLKNVNIVELSIISLSFFFFMSVYFATTKQIVL